ncbi:hypothetical protein BO79DRAFT_172117 [Aspergillus costaricaensis CBS 115574]|uniref:Uncharacterized protein n=1 Tax=Aspergillus costaricaensis CBS 115574 TaxID=1448317 RepID=A0ACD1IGC2_9EURO|nr:hypothetical protein BO79DRAFT_172117 [Aspergillus costaricaensis CBS 115574]RAK89620.1 hypothetical protein BO79DRAFT_172117 [Aspergillus costaricaensis CBS 115574]
MESNAESRDRHTLRKALTLLERDFSSLEDQGYYTLDETLLKRYHIQTEPLSLRCNDSLAPKFFGPFLAQGIPEPTEEYVDRDYNTARLTLSSEYGRLIYIYLQSYIRKLMIDFPAVRRVWSSNQIGDYGFGNLYRTFEPEFGTLSIFHVAKAARPHIKCIMHNDLNADDSHLLYGEVLTIVRIILGQLKQKVFVNDMIAPVLLFSLNRQRPRVIEAYYDGQKLVLRHTKSYDFTNLDKAEFKTFAQWFLGDPIGDTSKTVVRI